MSHPARCAHRAVVYPALAGVSESVPRVGYRVEVWRAANNGATWIPWGSYEGATREQAIEAMDANPLGRASNFAIIDTDTLPDPDRLIGLLAESVTHHPRTAAA